MLFLCRTLVGIFQGFTAPAVPCPDWEAADRVDLGVGASSGAGVALSPCGPCHLRGADRDCGTGSVQLAVDAEALPPLVVDLSSDMDTLSLSGDALLLSGDSGVGGVGDDVVSLEDTADSSVVILGKWSVVPGPGQGRIPDSVRFLDCISGRIPGRIAGRIPGHTGMAAVSWFQCVIFLLHVAGSRVGESFCAGGHPVAGASGFGGMRCLVHSIGEFCF